MNETVAKMGLTSTTYDSPHGMGNAFNTSTAREQALLAEAVMAHPVLRKVVSTGRYTCDPIYDASEELKV
jgi:D-alanyl-D-alanine carboxypeptidase